MKYRRILPCVRFALVTALLFSIRVPLLQASTLSPGSLVPAPFESGPVGATLLDSTTNAFVAPFSFSGKLTTKVWNNDASSPFSSGLTFTYELTMDPNPLAQPVSRFTISSFSGFLVDASYTNGTGSVGVPPLNISRSAPGDVIRFTFEDGFGNATLVQGTNSALLVLQTDAIYWQPTIAAVIDGASANVASLAPSVIPEPSAITVAAGALMMLLVSRRWQMRCS